MIEEKIEEKLTLIDQLQSACTHCGLCSEACATFQLTGWEHESPRGRFQLAAQFLHGRIHPQSSALSTFDRCLGCGSCEFLCPHHLPYHRVRQMVQELRRDLQILPHVEMEEKHYQQWLKLAQRISSAWWRCYGAKWLGISLFNCSSSGSFTKKHRRPQAAKPVLAVCCVQDLFQHDVIEQTLSFVQRLGYSLEVDRKQPCCGALFERLVQGGEETICYSKKQKKAASLQNKTRAAFLKWMPSQTYFLSRGCQCFISKQNVQTLDLYTWIESILDEQQLVLGLSEPQEVYYQPYCGYQKGMQDSVWRLLHRIQGLKVHEIPYPQACCGGYCGEMLLHPERAQAMAQKKISELPQNAHVVVTSPDCWGLFKSCSENRGFTIYYPLQLLSQGVSAKR